MQKRDKRIDEYIKNSAEFAQPILMHFRELIHKTCPNVEENLKWGMPSFEYEGLMCNMASFKHYCTIGFWKATLMKDKELFQNLQNQTSMGHLGKLTNIKELPVNSKLISWIKEAMRLNELGLKIETTKPGKAKAMVEPDYLISAFKKNKRSWITYSAFSQTYKNEYIEWITEAKTETTRNKRLQEAIILLEEGKPRNWKYMKKYAKK